MASSDRVQRALAAASELSKAEREELITELILGLERDREPEPGYDEAWSAEIRRRVDAVVSGRFPGRALRMVLEWRDLHEEALMNNWERLRSGELPQPIPPLA